MVPKKHTKGDISPGAGGEEELEKSPRKMGKNKKKKGTPGKDKKARPEADDEMRGKLAAGSPFSHFF